MKNFKTTCVLFMLLVSGQVLSAVLYVGTGAQCNQSNHYSSLALALAAAALNGVGTSDQIRLTNTVSYIGAGDGDNMLTGWNPSTSGELTISGGYADCNASSSSGMTTLGGGPGAVFEISGQSGVTLKNLQLFNSQNRGLIVREGSTVFLESVYVSGNVAGIRVLDGSILSVDAGSIVQNNGDLSAIPKGGGIWCFGNNTEVYIFGSIERNQAVSGGNMYIEDGCYAQLVGGSQIKGGVGIAQYSADDGGGIMVHDGGELYSNGGANRVLITDHWAFNGAGLYVHGTGRATLLNTYIANNRSDINGAGLYAVDGGGSDIQVLIDRVQSCPFLISCSEFEGNDFNGSVVEVRNSKVQINRTLFDSNQQFFANNQDSLVSVRLGGVLQMSHSNMIKNDSFYLFENYSNSEIAHHTAAGNYWEDFAGNISDPFVWFSTTGNLRFENSIFQDTQGGQNGPTTSPNITGKCNLIDDSNDWPGGAYITGTAQFNNVAGGDARQVASSIGVDMCLEDSYAWNNDLDIEYQVSPVNENTNPQGTPGEVGGVYDAGFDEVYDNIGNDEFLLTIQRTGSGDGVVISDPLGISCGTDCTEVVFNGTLVTLTATAFAESEFVGWSGCPLVSGSNQCLISVTESTTVFAEFQPDDLIFSDGFE